VGDRPQLVIIGGPTGVGKTAVAVALAARARIEVISADSRQVYRGMDAATGKPTVTQRAAVAHHLVDIVDPDVRYDAARFRADAERLIEEIRQRGRLPVIVGGTGLYIRALVRGLDPAPPADLAFRHELDVVARREGRDALHRRLAAEAPDVARRLHPNDQVRVVRALEKIRAGRGVLEQRRWARAELPETTAYFGLTVERATLARRLRARTEAFVAGGLRDEVARLLARGYDPSLAALRSIGYREFVQVVLGRLALSEAVRGMQRETVRYAKRQWTWFLREPGVEWIDVEAAGGATAAAEAIHRTLRMRGALA